MKAVIFDLDGTLADSALLTIEAFRQIAPGQRMPIPSAESIRSAIGYANPEFYDRLYPDHPQSCVRHLGDLVEEKELELLPTMGDLLFAGCRELLLALRARDIPIYIASTGSGEHVMGLLEQAEITGLFREIHCNEPEKTAMLRRIAQTGGQDFIMVGDMNKDSDGARAAGIPSVGACYGYCVQERTSFDHYIDKPMDLLEFLY